MTEKSPNSLKLICFENNIKMNWQDLQVENLFCDMTLACDGKKMLVHKIIISSSSPILRNIVKNEFSLHPFVFLRGVTNNDLENLVNFMYQGEVDVASNDLPNFLCIAEDLKIKGLSEGNGINIKLKESQAPYHQSPLQFVKRNKMTCETNHPNNKIIQQKEDDVENKVHHNCNEYDIKYEGDNTETIIKNYNLTVQSENENVTYSAIRFFDKSTYSTKLKPINNQYQCDQSYFKSTDFKVKENINFEKDIEPSHTVDSFQDFKYLCRQCDFKGFDKSDLIIHIQSFHKENNLVSCDKCDKHFFSRTSLRKHRYSVHRGIQYHCDQCNYNGSTKQGLKGHRLTHNQENLFACKKCDKILLSKGGLKAHIESIHEGIRYPCDQCNYKSTSKMGLKLHKTSHRQVKLYSCGKCDKMLPYKSSLVRHIKTVHEGFRYQCNQCSYKTIDTRHLKKHVTKSHESVISTV